MKKKEEKVLHRKVPVKIDNGTTDSYNLHMSFGAISPTHIWHEKRTKEEALMQTSENRSLYSFESKPPIGKALPISLQHIMAMFLGLSLIHI